MGKKLSADQSHPITARLPHEVIRQIDDWRRKQPIIPSISEFVRLAIEEKLQREKFLERSSNQHSPNDFELFCEGRR